MPSLKPSLGRWQRKAAPRPVFVGRAAHRQDRPQARLNEPVGRRFAGRRVGTKMIPGRRRHGENPNTRFGGGESLPRRANHLTLEECSGRSHRVVPGAPLRPCLASSGRPPRRRLDSGRGRPRFGLVRQALQRTGAVAADAAQGRAPHRPVSLHGRVAGAGSDARGLDAHRIDILGRRRRAKTRMLRKAAGGRWSGRRLRFEVRRLFLSGREGFGGRPRTQLPPHRRRRELER
jgi:hypothetical protein